MLASTTRSAESFVTARPGPDLVLVGGVPGAGKSTAIRQATADLTVRSLDPEQLQHRIRNLLSAEIPYRGYRWLVHVAHTLRVFWHLLRGPGSLPRLVVHDPGTRVRRRRLFVTLARVRGWRTTLLYLDVERSAARSGQWERGRVLDASAFDQHWLRWEGLRARLTGTEGPRSEDQQMILVDRDRAAATLRRLCLDQPDLIRTSGGAARDAYGKAASSSDLRSIGANDAVIELRAKTTRSAFDSDVRSSTAA